MKLIADVMLGRLARRLRLLGYDVLYDRTFQDNEIIRISLEQQRIILTRDTGMAKRPLAASHIFVRQDDVRDQVDEVLVALSGTNELRFSRCSRCNTELSDISKEEAIDLVPLYVYETHDAFLRCSACGRIYWRGSHVRHLKQEQGRGRAGQ